eukprot:3078448-Rhodomonas_salina.4
MSGSSIWRSVVACAAYGHSVSAIGLRAVRCWHRVCPQRTRNCLVLTCILRYHATRSLVLTCRAVAPCYELPGTDLPSGGTTGRGMADRDRRPQRFSANSEQGSGQYHVPCQYRTSHSGRNGGVWRRGVARVRHSKHITTGGVCMYGDSPLYGGARSKELVIANAGARGYQKYGLVIGNAVLTRGFVRGRRSSRSSSQRRRRRRPSETRAGIQVRRAPAWPPPSEAQPHESVERDGPAKKRRGRAEEAREP